MVEPSVKGSIFQSVAEDVKGLISQGVLDDTDLESMLSEKERAQLNALVTPLSWMPISTYCRLLEVMARFEGGASAEDYFRRRGAIAAERLLGGTYSSYDAQPGTWGEQVAKSMIGIARLLYNFTVWNFQALEGGVYEIRAEEAGAYPEIARHTAHGFLQAFADKSATEPMKVTSERARPDVVIFRVSPA
jgi:hypothetical protein